MFDVLQFVSERSDTATTSFYYDQGLSLVLEGRGTFLFMRWGWIHI